MTIYDQGIGLERLQREAFIVLFNKLNDELALVESAWAQLDQQLSTLTPYDYVEINLEGIQPQNFYLGHRPSLIQAPINRYPNVSIMAWRAGSEAPDNIDQLASYRQNLAIEVMVKSRTYKEADEPDLLTAETEVNARIQRTTDAVNNVILANKSLNGVTTEISRTPSITLSDVFVREEKTSYGDKWLWQGSRLEYDVTKISNLSNTNTREGLNIDQV